MAPDTFRRWDIQAATVGTVSVPVDKGADPARFRVSTDRDRPLPFTVKGDMLRFFSGAPGTVHVRDGERETMYSLTLPDVGETAWKAPSTVAHGLPRITGQAASVANIWPWLAILGGLGLLIEWILYGRGSIAGLPGAKAVAQWTDIVAANAENNNITTLLVHPTDVTYKLTAEQRLLEAYRHKPIWIGSVTRYGLFARARAAVRATPFACDDHIEIRLNQPRAKLPQGLTLAMEFGPRWNAVSVRDSDGADVPFTTSSRADRRMLILKP